MTTNTNETPLVRLMRLRLEAAKLRVRAAHQDSSGYHRTAANPAYDGQEAICLQKAGVVDSLRAESLAQADLLEAEADAAYEAETGQKPPKGGVA